MSDDLEIVVRGTARGKYRPERAGVALSVRLEDPDKNAVYSQAVEVHSALTSSLAALEADDAITRWSSDSVRVYSYRPYDPKGRRREPLYNTTIAVDAEFVDFEKLSAFIDEWAGRDGVDVGSVAWDVTEENRLAYERELRTRAVADAVAKAQAYSDAAGRGQVIATQLADPNMLSEPRPAPMMRAMAAPVGDAGGPALELRSDDIDIVVAVDARFVAR